MTNFEIRRGAKANMPISRWLSLISVIFCFSSAAIARDSCEDDLAFYPANFRITSTHVYWKERRVPRLTASVKSVDKRRLLTYLLEAPHRLNKIPEIAEEVWPLQMSWPKRSQRAAVGRLVEELAADLREVDPDFDYLQLVTYRQYAWVHLGKNLDPPRERVKTVLRPPVKFRYRDREFTLPGQPALLLKTVIAFAAGSISPKTLKYALTRSHQ